MFAVTFPVLNALNIMHLKTPESAVLSAVIFNALIIIALIPLALRGVKYRAMNAEALLRKNLFIYGLGGLIAPFIGIKIIDVLITDVRLEAWSQRNYEEAFDHFAADDDCDHGSAWAGLSAGGDWGLAAEVLFHRIRRTGRLLLAMARPLDRGLLRSLLPE